MAANYFTVDLGDYYLRVADADFNNDKFNLKSVGAVQKPLQLLSTDSEKAIVEEMGFLEKFHLQLGIKKKSCLIIIPDNYVFSQIMEMPILKEKELLSAIKYQSDQFIPLPLEETSLDIDVIYQDKVNKKLLILIVAAPNVLIEKIEDAIERSGLIPEIIENEASVFARYISRTNLKENTVFVNLNYNSTSLYFYNNQLNIITDIHNFKLGLNLFIKEVQINFNLSQEKAIEALKTIGFSQTGTIDLIGTIKPVINGFVSEIEKFILNVKEKYKIDSINQLVVYNLSDYISHFDQALAKPLGLPGSQFNLTGIVSNPAVLQSVSTNPSGLVSAILANQR